MADIDTPIESLRERLTQLLADWGAEMSMVLKDLGDTRARLAGAVNTLVFDGDAITGDNTDGIGFVRDVRQRLKFEIEDAAILVLGAGGGVRGLIGSLLEEKPKWIAVANRTHDRAQELADEFGVLALSFDEVPAEHFDLVINGTATSLSQNTPPIDAETFDDCMLAYDLLYSPAPTPFIRDTGFCPKTRISREPARRRTSPLSARPPRRSN